MEDVIVMLVREKKWTECTLLYSKSRNQLTVIWSAGGRSVSSSSAVTSIT
jgi:hypothetical protein